MRPLLLLVFPVFVGCADAQVEPGPIRTSDTGERTDAGMDPVDAGEMGTAEREHLEWRQAGGNAQRSFWSLSAALTTYAPLWEVQVKETPSSDGGLAFERSPLVFGDVVLAVSSRLVAALELSTGAERWRTSGVKADGALAHDLAILPNGGVRALRIADGSEVWRRSELDTSSAVLWDGTYAFVGAFDDGWSIVALDHASGETVRKIPVATAANALVLCEGTLVSLSVDGVLRAFTHETGALSWSRTLEPAVIANGYRSIRCVEGRVVAHHEHAYRALKVTVVDAHDGALLWSIDAGPRTRIVAAHGVVAVGLDGDADLQAYSLETGEPLWTGAHQAFPVAAFDGAFLVNQISRDAPSTVLLDAATGTVRAQVSGNLSYATAIACGKLIGGGRGVSIPGPTVRVIGDPARVAECRPSQVH